MNFDIILATLFHLQLWDIVKVLLEIGLLIYAIFALIVIRQVELMGGVLGITLTPILRFIAVVHFFITVGVFILALLIL